MAPSRRSVIQIKEAIAQAQEAQTLFSSLAEAQGQVAYPLEIAQQRVRYGNNLINRANTEMLSTQEAYEQSEQARIEATRAEREAEKARQAQLELARLEEIRAKNEKLAEDRRQMQEAAREMYEKYKFEPDDEDNRKRGPRKKKEEGDFVVGDGEGEEKPKIKRAPKRKVNFLTPTTQAGTKGGFRMPPRKRIVRKMEHLSLLQVVMMKLEFGKLLVTRKRKLRWPRSRESWL